MRHLIEQQQLARQQLIVEFRTALAKGIIDPRIPDPEHNGNYNKLVSRLDEYVRDHIESSCLKELPYIIRKAHLSPNSKILDYGCGWGRLAFAASNYLNQNGLYVGIDINRYAIDTLKSSYSKYENFDFLLYEVKDAENYIYLQEEKTSPSDSEALDVIVPAKYEKAFDAIYTCSVFTHMWKDAIIHILKEQAKALNYNGTCINTWLIIDQYAQYILRCGLADRQLPFQVKGAFTYSLENPLLCTAYSLEDVYDMYAQAGHQIFGIEFGSWSGRENQVIYTDIVLSKPLSTS